MKKTNLNDLNPMTIGALNYEYALCFEVYTREDYIEENERMPESGFLRAWYWLIELEIDKLIDYYSEEIADSFLEYEEDDLDKIIEKLENKYKECVEKEKMRDLLKGLEYF